MTVTMQMCFKKTLKESPPALGREESMRVLSSLVSKWDANSITSKRTNTNVKHTTQRLTEDLGGVSSVRESAHQRAGYKLSPRTRPAPVTLRCVLYLSSAHLSNTTQPATPCLPFCRQRFSAGTTDVRARSLSAVGLSSALEDLASTCHVSQHPT